MTEEPEGRAARLLNLLRSFAAQSGPFRPADAIHAAGPDAAGDPLVLAEALSKLHTECSVAAGPAGDLWLYRPEMRRKVQASAPIDAAATDASPKAQALAAAPDRLIADAQAGRGDFGPQALDDVIATSQDADRLAGLAVTLERAGPQAPGHDRLVTLRSALNAARERARNDALLAQGFVGRAAELARIADWIARPKPGLPVRALLVGGLPGIGKSLLLERAVKLARETTDPILIRLDFDRPALGSGEDGGLFDEISRLVADNLPSAAAELRALRLAAAGERVRLERGSGRRYLPRDLLAGIVRVVRAAVRPVLVLLDTLDVLQSRGATFPDALMASFDRMVEAGMPDMTVIAAGRGQVFLQGSPRVAEYLELGGLEAEDAERILALKGVDPAHRQRILGIARGNPLLLDLAARAAAAGDMDATEPDGIPASVASGYLQHAIANRLPEDLREIAVASLMLTRIDAETVLSVVAPALGVTPDARTVNRILAALGEQTWLAGRDGADLAQGSAVRAFVAGLVRAGRPALADRIDSLAASHFADRDPLVALYHRLQGLRSGSAVPRIPPDLAARLPPHMLAELPVSAREAVSLARAARSPHRRGRAAAPGREAADAASSVPGVASSGLWLRIDPVRGRIREVAAAPNAKPPPDPHLLADLESTLASGALEEAAHVMARGFPEPFRADSTEGRLALTQLWLTGQWAVAGRLFRAQPRDALDRALAESPQLVGRVLVEIWAEFRFARLRSRLGDAAFRQLTARAMTEPGRIALRGGALDFAVIAASGDAQAAVGVDEGLDVLSGRMHGVSAARVSAARTAADTLRSGFGLEFRGGDASMTPEQPWEAGARIAPLNPYDGPLRALVNLHDRQGGSVLTRRIARLAPDLAEIAQVYAPGVEGAWGLAERVTAHAPGLVDALGALGLTAEWSGGLSAVTRQADLALIARAAERWRRTVCGVWAYPSALPAGWTGTGPPDWGSRNLAAAFGADSDPQGRARRALAFWSSDIPAAPGRLMSAAAATVAGLNPADALAVLLQQGHPVSVAVPLAFLSTDPQKNPFSPHSN